MIERYESRLANSVYALYKRSVNRKEPYPFLDANLERMIPGLFNFLEEISDSNEFFEVISELDIALEKEFIEPMENISGKKLEAISQKYPKIMDSIIVQEEIKDPIFVNCAHKTLRILILTLQKLVPSFEDVLEKGEKTIHSQEEVAS